MLVTSGSQPRTCNRLAVEINCSFAGGRDRKEGSGSSAREMQETAAGKKGKPAKGQKGKVQEEE